MSTETLVCAPTVEASRPETSGDDWGFRHRAVLAAIVLIPATMLSLFSTPHVREGSWIDAFLDVVAWAVFLAGPPFRFWATLYIGGRKPDVVVDEGPYSVCRNPLYLGSLLIAVGAG